MKKYTKKGQNLSVFGVSLESVGSFYILGGGMLFFAFVLLGWFGYRYISYKYAGVDGGTGLFRLASDKEKMIENKLCAYTRLLDGECVEREQEISPLLVGVMIENHVDARPQSGLSNASVVYEAPAEGNITRFLALYPSDASVLQVGPVRSARPYYLDWASEYPLMMYMHVGGSPAALDILRQGTLFGVNEMYKGWYFWRSADRFAPHNVYTSSELWNDAIDHEPQGEDVREFVSWDFKNFEEGEQCESDCVTEISVAYAAPWYGTVWKYSTTTATYTRYQMDEPHVDSDGSLLKADTVIVQYVDAQVIDAVGRLKIHTLGEGKTIVLRNGKKIDGTWRKEERGGRTQWLDEEENSIPLKPGKLWIEIVPQTGRVEWK